MAYLNQVNLERMYIGERMSIHEIANSLGKSYTYVRYWLIKYGIHLRDRNEAVKDAIRSGKRYSPGHRCPHTKEAREKMSRARKQVAERTAVGVSLKPNGYIEITRGKNKNRSVHDVLMEEYLGRPLMPGEVVHHINGNKTDNRIENLMVMTKADHSRLHAKMRNQLNK